MVGEFDSPPPPASTVARSKTMATIHKSDITGRETKDEDQMHTIAVTEDGMVVDEVEFHKDDQPEEIRRAVGEMVEMMALDQYGEETGLGDLFE